MISLRLQGISLRFDFSFFTVLALLCTLGNASVLTASLGAIALHECAHLFIMLLLRQHVKSMTFYGCGIRICPSGILCSYRKELLILLAGPFANLSAWCILWMCGCAETSFALASLALGIFNLLPCRHLDGGAALRCLLCLMPWERLYAERAASIFACIVLVGAMATAWVAGVQNFTYHVLCVYLFAAEILR